MAATVNLQQLIAQQLLQPHLLHISHNYSQSLNDGSLSGRSLESLLVTLVGSVLPAALVALFLLFSTGLPQALLRRIVPSSLQGLTDDFVTDEHVLEMEEEEAKEDKAQDAMKAAALANGDGEHAEEEADERTPLLGNGANHSQGDSRWPKPNVTVGLAVVSLMHIAGWLGALCYNLVEYSDLDRTTLRHLVATHILILLGWTYLLLRTILRPQRTPPYDSITLLLVYLFAGVLRLHSVNAPPAGLPSRQHPTNLATAIPVELLSLALILYAHSLIGGLPVHIPKYQGNFEGFLHAPNDPNVDARKFSSPEETCSLFNWFTFRWIGGLLRATRKGKLDEEDVWSLGKTLRARVVFAQFERVKANTLIPKLFFANGKDMSLDFTLSVISAMLEYASPFFLKRILETIQTDRHPSTGPLTTRAVFTALVQGGDTTTKETAYLFAFLAFLCVVSQTQVDLHHLYFGRRASARARSELISAIYAKGLRGKDVSGLVEGKSQAKEEDGKVAPDKDEQGESSR